MTSHECLFLFNPHLFSLSSGFQRDIEGAKLRRAGVDEETIERLRADKEEAKRLAQLVLSASSRGAAPLPPGKGGKPAAPSAPSGD